MLETSEGNTIGICMRDDTFEISVNPTGEYKGNWWRVNMQDGTIEQPTPISEKCGTPESGCVYPNRQSKMCNQGYCMQGDLEADGSCGTEMSGHDVCPKDNEKCAEWCDKASVPTLGGK